MKDKSRVLFLYSELATYTLACIEPLAAKANVLIVHWPVNEEAPFKFSFSGTYKALRKPESLHELLDVVSDFSPDVCYVSGWLDSDYLQVIKQFDQNIPVIMGLDTPFNGSLKQRLNLFRKQYLQRIISHVWVASSAARKYAVKLGFEQDQIISGVYCADVTHYQQIRWKPAKRFVFIGRNSSVKGFETLLESFKTFHKDHPDWELHVIGEGFGQLMQQGTVVHGFLQGEALFEVLNGGGVFTLPSLFEPWGVVVHEACSAGFPIILSSEVGAKDWFLDESKNGLIAESGDRESWIKAMTTLGNWSDDQLMSASEHSVRLAQNYTPLDWSNKLLSLLPCVE